MPLIEWILVSWTITWQLTAANCSGAESCFGHRPRSSTGCCPLRAGDQCGDSEKGICDSELGYTCKDGSCAGDFNVTVGEVTHSSIELTWADFQPPGYQYEYSVMYTTAYSPRQLTWNRHEVGFEPRVTLRDLAGDTVYFVRVGTWADPVAGTFANLTEVAMVQTNELDHCLYDNQIVPVGKVLMVECDEHCVCMSTGTFHCVPVCPRGNEETPSCTVHTRHGLECCEPVDHCTYENCSYQSTSVQHGETWQIGCDENCTCVDGVVTCSPLCDDVSVAYDCAKPVRTTNGAECCGVLECNIKDESCTYKNQTHPRSSWFFHGDCELCTCTDYPNGADCVLLDQCGSGQTPPYSVVCPRPMVIDNFCCTHVVCQDQSELEDILEILTFTTFGVSTLVVRFQFISDSDRDLVHAVTLLNTDNDILANTSLWMNYTLNLLDSVDITNNAEKFPFSSHSSSLIRIGSEYFISVPKLRRGIVYYTKLIMTIKTENNNDEVVDGKLSSNTFVIHIKDETKTLQTELPPETSIINSSEDKYRLPNRQTLNLHIANISSTSVVVKWSKPRPTTNLFLRYKRFRDKIWTTTAYFNGTNAQYTLTCLAHSTWYIVELMSIPIGDISSKPLMFNTTDISETTDPRFETVLTEIQLLPKSVVLEWKPLEKRYTKNITSIEILWIETTDGAEVIHTCIPIGSNTYTLTGLKPETLYKVWLGIVSNSGGVIYSNVVHFITADLKVPKPDSHHGRQIVTLAVVSSVGVCVLLVTIAAILYMTRCRRKAAYQPHTSFENKIFQIHSNSNDPDL